MARLSADSRGAPSAFAARYGPWALVAGASEGIGAAFAAELASRGQNLALIARREGPLRELAASLSSAHGVETRALPLDLGAPDLAERVAELTADLEIGLVVCNAAVSLVSPFFELDVSDVLRSLDVNARAPLVLAHVLGARMRERGRGGIVFMSSLAGLYSGPFVATYAATKAFDNTLAESLAGELAPHGVDVVACVAGPTRTPAYDAVKTSRFPPVLSPEEVVAATLGALGKTPRVIPGAFNRLTERLLSLLPRRLVVRMVAAQTRRYLPRRA
jgi:short-subunit dehydrogenase